MNTTTYMDNELRDIKKMLRNAVRDNDWDYVHSAIEYIDEYLESYYEEELEQ